jgi:dTDP-4-dehydrorhamnose reductase
MPRPTSSRAALQRIVLLAPYGLLGAELARSLTGLGQVLTLSRAEVDFADTTATAIRVAALAPTVIVNAAGFTAVDLAESATEQAFLLNASLPEALAQLAARRQCWLVHISSDYVYSGAGRLPWTEQDHTAPLSVYGASKLAGDQAVLALCNKALILRTSWLYDSHGRHFLQAVLPRMLNNQGLQVVDDQIGAPTPARVVAQQAVLILRQLLSGRSDAGGLYHLACQGETSWYGFACAILQQLQQQGMALQAEVAAVSTARYRQLYPQAAARPFNSRLALGKVEQHFGLQLPDWQSQLVQVLSQYRLES